MTPRLLYVMLEELPEILEDRDRDRLELARARSALRSIDHALSRDGGEARADVRKVLDECADLWREAGL